MDSKTIVRPVKEEATDNDWSPIDVGRRMMNLRLRRGWTQMQLGSEMARYVDLAFKQNTISDYESGRRGMRGKILLAAAQALGTTLDYLVTGRTEAEESGLHPETETAQRIMQRLPETERQAALESIRKVADEHNHRRDKNYEQYRDLIRTVEDVLGRRAADQVEAQLGARV